MFCQKCGQENEDSAKFCSSCGNGLSVDAAKSAEQKAEDIKQKSKESASTLFYLIKPLLKLKILVPAVAIALGVVFYPSMKSTYKDYQYEKKKEAERLIEIAKEKRETFTDPATGLIWQDTSHQKRRNWSNSITYCENIEYAGYSDWRLPTIKELESILDTNKDPNIISGFVNIRPIDYWSSSEDISDSVKAWEMNFGAMNFGHNAGSYEKLTRRYARCVRGRQ